MTPQQINKLIAEAVGWKNIASNAFGHMVGQNLATLITRYLPDYATDLNAMHEAEGTLTRDQWLDYSRNLGTTSGFMEVEGEYGGIFVLLHATAAQRSEAFLRTLGKWEDGV